MDPISIIAMLVVGAVAGWLAGQIMSGSGFGLVGNILIGIAGAFVAGLLLPGFIPIGGILGQIISATIGALIFLFVLGLLRRLA